MSKEMKVLVEEELLPIDMTDKEKRADFILAMQGLQKSNAWKYMRGYFAGLLESADSAMDSVGDPHAALILAAKRGTYRKVVAFPETMLKVAESHIKQGEINEKRAKEQPDHPMAPRMSGRKKE